MASRQGGSVCDGTGAQNVIEPVNAHGALGTVVGEIRCADGIGSVRVKGVVKVPQAVVQLDQSRCRGLRQGLIVEAHSLEAACVNNVAGHGNALSRKQRGGFREAAVPENLRCVGIGVRHGIRLILGHVAVNSGSGLACDGNCVTQSGIIAEVNDGRRNRKGLRCACSSEDAGLHRQLSHEVDAQLVRDSLEGKVGAVLVAEREVVVHRNFAGISAKPAGLHTLVQEHPAGIGSRRSVQIGQIAVCIVEDEGSVILVDVDAVRHRADLIGDGDERVCGDVLDLQDAGRHFSIFQKLLRLAVGGSHDDLAIRIVVADAHAGLPALGAVGDLREHKLRFRTGAFKADRKRKRRAERGADPVRNVEEGLMLQNLLRSVVGAVVLVVIGAVQAIVIIRTVKVGVDLRPQVQATELLQADEAADRHGQFAGHGTVTALFEAGSVFHLTFGIWADELIDAVRVTRQHGIAFRLLG